MSGAPAAGTRPERIRALLGGPLHAALLAAVRERLEADPDARTVALSSLEASEREAVASLLGWPSAAGRRRLAVAEIDEALRSSALQAGLREVLEAVGGPLRDRRGEREAERADRERLFACAALHPAVAGRSEILAWVDDLRRGLLHRQARTTGADPGALLDLSLRFAARLPAGGQLLAVLAAEVAGDAHALDPGAPVTPLVLRAAARLAGWSAVPAGALGRRNLWAEVGVTCDPLSADVLVLGLRPPGPSRLARALREAADEGEPQRLTLRELGRTALAGAGAETLHVCENPVVVAAAADRLGARSAPLVCVEGQPTSAALLLLEAARAGGAHILFHADFDWAGVRIGNTLAARLGARPWRYSEPDYLEAAGSAVRGAPLAGKFVEPSWDGALGVGMSRTGRAVHEEQVVEKLLEDLERAAPRR